ncbi:MAG: HAD-IA family hydrolase [Rhodobiaceae bacterium]|nr:HAD-IA family hydrolase [Rhodobiaceae bacterium]
MADPAQSLVIFDCDGVLVDSEPIAMAVLTEVLAEAGLTLDQDAAYDQFLGRSTASVAGTLAERYGLTLTPGLVNRIRTRLYDRLERELKPVPQVGAVVAGLAGARCVASSSQMERIRLSLAATGLLDLFEPYLFSACDVERGKPAPDLFLHVAAAMGIRPADCTVIEDSPAGIAAAKAAGMRVFAFIGAGHAEAGGLHDRVAPMAPDAIFSDMRDLPGLLTRSALGETTA